MRITKNIDLILPRLKVLHGTQKENSLQHVEGIKLFGFGIKMMDMNILAMQS